MRPGEYSDQLCAMRRLIPFRTAGNILCWSFILVLLFQIAVLAGAVPTGMVWGGRLQNDSERTLMSLVSIAVLLLFFAIVRIRTGHGRRSLEAFGRYGSWVIVLVFALNTLGNLVAVDFRETLIFTPITLVLALLALRVALGDAGGEKGSA